MEDNALIFASFEWPPFQSDKTPNQGAMVAITRAALESKGYALEVKFFPFPRMIEEIKAGRVDGAIGIYHTEAREGYMHFTNPIFTSENVLFARKDKANTFFPSKD